MNNKETESNKQEELEIQETSPSKVSLFIDDIKNWINQQNKVFFFGIVAIISVTALYVAYTYLYKMPKEKKGLEALYITQELFDVDSFNSVLKTAPKLAAEYSGTKAGNLANYYAGVSYLRTGNSKKAIEFLSDVSFSDRMMKPQAIGLLGDAYIESKDLEKGLKQYLKAVKSSKNELSEIWWSKKAARVYEKQENWKSALAIYEDLLEKYKTNEDLIDLPKHIARAEAKLDIY